MVRGLVLLALACSLILLVSPFLISSLYVDQRGIDLTGQVYSKREDVRVHNSGWARSSEVTIEYEQPEPVGPAFFGLRLDPEQYDKYHVGEKVKLHYLRRRDIPDVPGADILWQMHALTVVRLANQRAFSRVERFLTKKVIVACVAFAALMIMLWLWRHAGLPGFVWAAALCVLAGLAVLFSYDFPRPTPAPAVDVRQATGKVKSLDRITRLFEGSRSRGMLASQAIEVVGIEFVPEGRRDPVLAVDLIDAGSVPGLKPDSPVNVTYEAWRPRTAYLSSGTRAFLPRNLAGIVGDGVLYIGVLLGGLLIVHLIGKGWTRLIAR